MLHERLIKLRFFYFQRGFKLTSDDTLCSIFVIPIHCT
ncbi:unnamed protein product [Musa acuminata subsp. burmannicoides]